MNLNLVERGSRLGRISQLEGLKIQIKGNVISIFHQPSTIEITLDIVSVK